MPGISGVKRTGISIRTSGRRTSAGRTVVKPVVRFTDQNHLLELLTEKVIAPAEKLIEKRQELLNEVFGRA
jgi:hypothetical protein